MANLTTEENNNIIKGILESEDLTPKQQKIIREFYKHLKEKNFSLDSCRLKLFHVNKAFQDEEYGYKLFEIQDRTGFFQGLRSQDMRNSLEYFFRWYDKKAGLRDYQDIQKDIRKRRIKALLNYERYSDKQKEIVNAFYGYLNRRGLKNESKRSYLQNLKLFFRDLKKDIDTIDREDIDDYLVQIGNYKPKTQTERRKFLIVFFEWYFKKEKKELDLIKDMDVKKDKGTKLPEEILSPEEIKRMIQVADNFRDKALIVLLYETGARKGEFLQLKIKHIDITNREFGLISIPQGKTDSRKLPIIYSVPHIQNLLNSHPRRDDPNSPLFVNHKSWLGRALGEDGLKRLVKSITKRAGIKKNVYPHLFRHSRLTELGKELTEQELKKFAGWTPSSNMAEVYVHLSGKDVTNKILANAGLIDQKEFSKGKECLKGVKCPRCNKVNSGDIKFCDCGFCLDLKEMNTLINQKMQDHSEILKLVKKLSGINPEGIRPILELNDKIASIEAQLKTLK